MHSPTRSAFSPIGSRIISIIPERHVISSRSISSCNGLEISIHSLQNEQERVQKKTFTKWVNIYLSLHEPPYFITDLFEDFKDGTKLIALLEVLSGQTLPIERGNKRAHFMSNVDNALKFLASRKIKLINIRPLDIVDGNPTIILGLVWMLILFFQIQDSSMLDEDSKENRIKAKENLLEWVRKKITGFSSSSGLLRMIDNLDIRDFTSSWRDGLAFNALIYAIRPELIDVYRVKRMDVRQRLENAFVVAEQHLGVPRLIDAEDVDVTKPDEKSIMTYVAQFSRRFPDLAYVKEVKEFIEKQNQWKTFERKESKSPHFPGEKLKELKYLFDDTADRMNQWRNKLDANLPSDLRQIAEWINRAEEVLQHGININPSELTPEQNLERFNQFYEEHITIFMDKDVTSTKFQRLKRDPLIMNKQIAIEHLTNLDERLNIIMNNSEERGRYLDFEQTHWKIQIYFIQLENLMKFLNKKQGDFHQTEQLFNEYKRKIYDEKLVITIESLATELLHKAQSYSQLGKKDERVAKEFHAYCENIRKILKSAVVDLKTKEHILQETLDNWKIYQNSYDQLKKWLTEGEQILQRSLEEKLNYFANINHWSQTHEKLHKAIEYLMSVCDDEISANLRNKLLFINRRWIDIYNCVQTIEHDQTLEKKRNEFYTGRTNILDALDKIDREIKDYLPCTIKALKEQDNRLYKVQSGIDILNENIQTLVKLSQSITRDNNTINEMNSLIQTCYDKLRHIKEYLPLVLKRNKMMYGYLQKFDDDLQKCHQWFNETKQLISRYSIQVSVKRVEEFLEQHRNYFADIGYYQSLIDSKGKLILTMKKSNEMFIPLNFSPVDEQYQHLTDTFEKISKQVTYWDNEFNQHCQLWKNFHQRLKHLQDWIDQAQNIVNEKQDDCVYLIRKHKDFFHIIDDEILHGFTKSGRELLHIRDKNEQKEIQYLIDTLELKWKTIVCYAPIRLLRLKFERIENIIVKELEQAENELNHELKQLEHQQDISEILRRHNEHFQLNNFHPTMEIHMRDLQTYADDIRTTEQGQTLVTHENEQINQRTIKLNNYWMHMQTKIDNVKRKLQIIPKKWRDYEEKFHQVETWMKTIERSINDTQNIDLPFEQYKLIVNKFKNDAEQMNTISNYTKSLVSLLNELIEEQATDEPARHRQRLDTLLSHYKQLCISIEETSKYCYIIIPSKFLHENILQLSKSLTNISNISVNILNLSDVRNALQNQTQVHNNLQKFSPEVNELITHGTDLIKQPLVPKYVQQDVQTIQKVYNEKIQSAQDLVEKLQHLLNIWEHFDRNKCLYQQQIEQLNNEFLQLNTNRNSISSYQHEIDNAKKLQNSYINLKPLLKEMDEFIQTISSNNLLSYENLQILKRDYENMHEDLNEKLRITEEILQDLINDNDRWRIFNDELKRLEIVYKKIESTFDPKTFADKSLEEKQLLLERIRTDLAEYVHSLSILNSANYNPESLHFRPKDYQNVINRLNQLRKFAETVSLNINHEEVQISECRTHVQTSQRYIDQLQPWIEQAENYLNQHYDQSGSLNINGAKQLLDKHKEFLDEHRSMSIIYNNLNNEEHNLSDQNELKSSIKSLSIRWIEIERKSDELTSKYDSQYRAWILYDSELNAFRNKILSEFEQQINGLISNDIVKLYDLNQINTLINDLRLLEENLHHHTSDYNRLHKQMNDVRLYCTSEGQHELNEEQIRIETRWNQLNRLITDKIHETEHLYESRTSFHNRFESFERSIRNIGEQIENNAQIQTSNWNQTYENLQRIQNELQSIQPLLITVGHELADLEVAGLPRNELQTIQNTYEAHRQRLNTYEIILQKRIDLLKRFENHLISSNDIRTKFQDIHDTLQQKQQLKIHDIDLLKNQIQHNTNDLRTIQSESSILDRLMEESNTTITDSTTNRTLFFTVETRSIQNLVDMIENKLIQRRAQTEEIDQLVEDFTQAQTHLLQRINVLSNELRSARLAGYAISDIESLMVIIKHLQGEIEHELDPLFKQLIQKSVNTAVENEDMIQKSQTEWEKLNIEVNERLHVLQRAQTLYSEIDLLRKQVETTINRVDMLLNETITSSNSLQQAKDHLNKLKQIELDQYKSAEHDMMICQKRCDEFISLLIPWYDMDWSKFFDLSELLVRMRDTFDINLRHHIKHTETICNYLQSIKKLRDEIDSKIQKLDELLSKVSDNIDQDHFLDIIQIQRPIINNLFTQFDEQLTCIKLNCDQPYFDELDQYRHNIHERLQNFDYEINQFIEKERRLQDESTKLLTDLESINPFLLNLTKEIQNYENMFTETESIENFIKLHQEIKQIQNELLLFNNSKIQQLNDDIQQYTNNNIRHESTQLSTALMKINNRYRIMTQDLNRFLERIDERIENETNHSIENYREFIESLRNKLTRIRSDHRLTIDVKQRLINEIAQSLTNGRVYVYQTIEEIKQTRNLLNNEYNTKEIDDECQAIDDEWNEFLSDFDDQKQEINHIENDIQTLDSEIHRIHHWLKEQENSFQLMIANQSTLELKLDKLEQIKILIENLETYVDLKEDLKKLENKVSIVSLTHNYNQYIDRRQQLLSNAQDALIQVSEAVKYHAEFDEISQRFNQWITDVENQLEQHTSTNEIESNYAIDEHYRSVENLINENIDGESLLSNLDDCFEQILKTTSIEGRTQIKYLLTKHQTRWSNYNIKQKELKQILHNIKMDRMEFDETLNELNYWIIEHYSKLDELTNNLSLRDENRKRLYQLKNFSNDINVKQTLINKLKGRIVENDRFNLIEENLNEFEKELEIRTNSLEEYLRIQISIEDNKQLTMEKLKFLMDRLSLCTKTNCDFDTLQSRLNKIEEYKNELESLEKDFEQSYEQYQSVVELKLLSMIKLHYQQNFEQMHLVIENGKQTIERAILELNYLCDIWFQYDKHNQLFVAWLNQTENHLNEYLTINNDNEQHTIEYLNKLSENIADKDKQLKKLEELELSITDYDWSRQAHNTSILRQRIIVLLGQCDRQLERAQQSANFNQQWENLLSIVNKSFEDYQRTLNEIHQEQTFLIHLDTIQDIQQLRIQCEQDMKQLETFATTGYIHSNKKESNRTEIRTLKIQLNELNELFSTIQQDLQTRSQACELVQTCIDEINLFLDTLPIQSDNNETPTSTLIKNLHDELNQFDIKSKRLRTIDPFLSHCTTELMRTFESMTNRFQLRRKELEIIINDNESLYTRQQEFDILLIDLERNVTYLTSNYETFENIQRDNQRELEIKLDKHRQLFQSIEELDKQLINIRSKFYEGGSKQIFDESIEKRLNHLEENLSNLQDRATQTVTFITSIKLQCEQIIADIKQMNDWLKLTDQQLNKYLVINLNTAEDKNDAAKRLFDKLDEFIAQENVRQQIRQRSDNLFNTLDDAPLQANLDDLDRTFLTLQQQIQHRYETLNRAGHHHSDYDQRLYNLLEAFSSLQTTFRNIQHEENNSNILFQLKNFKTERDDFEEELRRMSYINEQIISETSIEGSENLKLKLKQFQTKWKTFNNDIQSFEEKLAQQDEEQRLVLNEQATIEETLNTIQQQLQNFDQQISHDDYIRQRLQQMTNILSNVEKFHSHLLSPSSSIDTTIVERAKHLSSYHEQLKTTTEKKIYELNQNEKYSNEIISYQQILQNLIDTCSIRLQTFRNEKSKNEIYIQRTMNIFEDHRNGLNDLIIKSKDLKTKLLNESFSEDITTILHDKINQIINDAEQCSENLIQTETECQYIQELINEQKKSIDDIQQSLFAIEQITDGFILKQSIDEKLLQKEELNKLQEQCLEYGNRLIQINVHLADNHIDDAQITMITNETKRKCDELIKHIQHLLRSCDEIINKQTTFDETYNDVRKSIESLHEKYQSSLELDSGVAELSALLSECDSLRDRLDFMTSSYNTIDTQLRTRHLSVTSTEQNHTMKGMLQQTKDEFNRLEQTLRSSKQTIESKQQRLQTLNKQLNDIEHEYELIIRRTKVSDKNEIIKDDQYEYKEECQRRKLIIQDIEPKQNRLQIIINEANDLNDLQLVNNAKRLVDQFDHLCQDLAIHLDECERRYQMLQKFSNECSTLQQSLQTIQNELSPILDTYGDKQILEDKFKKLIDIKNNYQDLTPTLEHVEQMANEVLNIVSQNGKLSIRREWERIQTKSHHMNTTLIKIEQQLENCIQDWLSYLQDSEQLSIDLNQLELSLKLIDIRIQNDGQTSIDILQNMKNDFDNIENKLNNLYRFTSDLSQRTQETVLLEHLQQLQRFLQQLKILFKELLRRATDGQIKYSLYSQQINTYNQLINKFESNLNEIINNMNMWNDNQSIYIETIKSISNDLQLLINDQSTIQRQLNLLNEITESLVDSVENPEYFRETYLTKLNQQTDLFQKVETAENQLNILLQQINDIKKIKTKIIDSHINIERKFKQINEFISTINIDEKQERLILSQVFIKKIYRDYEYKKYTVS
ncbi:unnamed protein product [Adineta steineri]|uniref:Calponin-homology (CH) domain-containing protein n=1 Tax=Adineta steineri TaxID=433720 RepID=A0A819BM59_9BILA|nr:unnamed protein product [Adineta steineri]